MSEEKYKYIGKFVHIDLSPVYHSLRKCIYCKVYWIGDGGPCPKCGICSSRFEKIHKPD